MACSYLILFDYHGIEVGFFIGSEEVGWVQLDRQRHTLIDFICYQEKHLISDFTTALEINPRLSLAYYAGATAWTKRGELIRPSLISLRPLR